MQLEAITPRLAELAAAETSQLADRIKAIQEFDDSGRADARTAVRAFLQAPGIGHEEEERLWRTNREFWAQLAAAYNACLATHIRGGDLDEDKAALTCLVIRLLQACATRLKWDWFRYGPHSPGFWEITGHAYLYAVQEGFNQRVENVCPGQSRPTTVEHEYLKILMFQASSMDSLLPLEIEIAEGLIEHYLPSFLFFARHHEEHTRCTHWVDAGRRRAPARLMDKAQPSPLQRFFGAGAALDSITEHIASLERDETPPQFTLVKRYSPRVILPVLRHLLAYWAPKPPRRRYMRYPAESRLAVLSGLTQINQHLLASAHTPAINGDAGEWTIDNISRDGIGAQLRLSAGRSTETVRIGTLVCMRPEGVEKWLVGVVRRFSRETEEYGSVGIETLTRSPLITEINCAGRRDLALLLNQPRAGRTVRLVLPAGTGLCINTPLTLPVEGMTAHLTHGKLIETGISFDIARYRVESLV